MQLTATEVGSATDIVRALEAFGREPYGGLVAPPSNVTSVHRALILALVATIGCRPSFPTAISLLRAD